tara:strand:+ start:24405 stop:26252 length:1848 start_codon:yes stop_codon:yes gene_type:complete
MFDDADLDPQLPPLFRLALARGEPGGVLIHLRRGAPINGRDARGRTPLMIVALLGRIDLCDLLLTEGADTNLTDTDGNSAVELARKYQLPEVAMFLERFRKTDSAPTKTHVEDAPANFGMLEWEPETDFISNFPSKAPVSAVLDLQSSIASYRLIEALDEWSKADISLPRIELSSQEIVLPIDLSQVISAAMAHGWVVPKPLRQAWPNASENQFRLMCIHLEDMGVHLDRTGVAEDLEQFTLPASTQFTREASVEFLQSLSELLWKADEADEARYLSDISRFSGYGAEFEAAVFLRLVEARRRVQVALEECPELSPLPDVALTSSEKIEDPSYEEDFSDSEIESSDPLEVEGYLEFGVLASRLDSVGRLNLTPAMTKLSMALDGYWAARDRAVEGGIKLVPWVAHRYRSTGFPIEDLIQEGNIGLLRAVEKFDPSKGARFSTYAVWWIRQRMTRAISDQLRLIRVPVHALEASRKVERFRLETRTTTNRDATIDETVLMLEITRSLAQRVFNLPEVILSDVPDELFDETGSSPYQKYDLDRLKQLIGNILAGLPPRTERVLRMRFGLNASHDHTLEEIGEKFGVTRERIRQIEAKGLRKLRHPSRAKKLHAAYGR